MHIRIDPVARRAPVRLRVETIPSRRRPSDERRADERRIPAPDVAADAYAPPAVPAHRRPPVLDGALAALAARPPLAPGPAQATAAPAADDGEQSPYPSATPAWMAALPRGR